MKLLNQHLGHLGKKNLPIWQNNFLIKGKIGLVFKLMLDDALCLAFMIQFLIVCSRGANDHIDSGTMIVALWWWHYDSGTIFQKDDSTYQMEFFRGGSVLYGCSMQWNNKYLWTVMHCYALYPALVSPRHCHEE